MGLLQKIALVFVSLILIVSLTVVIIGSGIQTLLYPDIYRNSLENSGVYNELDKSFNLTNVPFSLKDEIRPIASNLIDSGLAYLRSDTNVLNLTVKIEASTVRNFLIRQAEALPICAQGQFSYDNISCRPAGYNTTQLVDMALAMNVVNLPSIDLAPYVNKDGMLTKARDVITIFRNVMNAVMLLTLGALFLIIALTRKSLKSMLRWIGANLVVVGIIGVIFLLLKEKVISLIPIQQSAVIEFAKIIISAVFDRIILYGGVLLAAGIAMIVFSFMLKSKEKKK